jgi:hypothetical protein
MTNNRTVDVDRQRVEIALRLKSPLRPAQYGHAAPVDGLGLFDQIRSPTML